MERNTAKQNTMCGIIRRLIISAAFSAAMTIPAFSQNDSLMNIMTQGSELRIEAAGFGITLGQGKAVFSDQDNRPARTRMPRVTTSLGISSLDFGFNALTGLRYTAPWTGHGDFLDMKGGKSIRVAWEPASVRVAVDRKANLLFSAGLRFTADNYMFSAPYTLTRDSNGILMPQALDGYIKKSKITSTYIGVPVRLTWRIARELRISATAAGELLLNAHTKYKKPKVKENIPGLSSWRVLAGGTVTYHRIGIYCDYSITPFFKEGTGAEANTISVGLRFGI